MHRVTVGEKGEWLYNNEPEFLELFKTMQEKINNYPNITKNNVFFYLLY